MPAGKMHYTEAAMKYFIMGALASAILLYGISFIYGATGSLNFSTIEHYASSGNALSSHIIMQFGLVFIVAGIAFKLGAFPFHMWVPDIYQGSSTPVTLLIGSIAKIAVFGMAYRLLGYAFKGMSVDWQPLLISMAVLSLGFGSIVAIAQTNLKRMLAYAAISHSGFMLLGFIVTPYAGYIPSMFYLITYSFTTLGGFSIIILLSSKKTEIENIEDLRGLHKRDPSLSFIMLILMLAMAGIPPTIGFYAKLLILQAIIQAGYIWLAVGALLSSVVSAFYYLRVIKSMYFENPSADQTLNKVTIPLTSRLAVSVNGILALILGICPAPILYICVLAAGNS